MTRETKQDRQKRLAEALRANLARRKQAGRSGAAARPDGDNAPDKPPEQDD